MTEFVGDVHRPDWRFDSNVEKAGAQTILRFALCHMMKQD
ncbi:hypothetical protein B4113_0310 [Geobacillus sp. B4113_201601]|nr:hypothetical protein B4113_0310 [Geobacillus sp. B4113_201601]